MRSTRTLFLGVLLLVLAACGGPATSSTESTGGEPSTPASQSASMAESPGEGGPAPSSLEELESELVPPNSNQVSRQEVAQGIVAVYESTDSVGDLRSYYIQKIAELNLTVISTQEAANSVTVAFGSDAAATGLGGTITLQNAGDVTNVALTLADAGM